jgi:tetratricopeptide (TPR) repeat protein
MQNVRHFTVKICHVVTEAVTGTGFLVSKDGKIITCKHVVLKASKLGNIANGVEVKVYFPQLKDLELEGAIARVTSYFSEKDDDVVLLELESSVLTFLESAISIGKVKPAILSSAHESECNDFITYGYRTLGKYKNGVRAQGRISGSIDRPSDLFLQADPIQLKSDGIKEGMSGGAVLDIDRDRVVGVISEKWDSGGDFSDRDTSFAVDCIVLSFEPINLQVEEVIELQSDDIKSAKFQDSKSEEQRIPRIGKIGIARVHHLLDDAPLPLSEWVGRENLLQALNEAWLDSKYCIMGLVGFGGEGKTSLASKWIRNLLSHSSLPQPDSVFWWDFNKNPSVIEFFSNVFEYLDIGQINPELLISVDIKAAIIRAIRGRYVFVLDGVEVLQNQEGDDYGLLKSNELRSFLRSFAEGNHQSFCLVTSRAPLIDLLDCRTYSEREVNPLNIREGFLLLKELGIKGSDKALQQVVKDWGGHALMLTLIGTYLQRRGGNVKRIREIPAPERKEPLHEQVQRIMNCYNEKLTSAERETITIISAFRLPVTLRDHTFYKAIFEGKTGAPKIPQKRNFTWIDWLIESIQLYLDRIFHRRLSESSRLNRKLQSSVDMLNSGIFNAMIDRLIRIKILCEHRQNLQSLYGKQITFYSIHILIRAYYLRKFKEIDQEWHQQIQQRIANYYESLFSSVPKHPTRENISPIVEAIHHLCQAQNFDKAWEMLTNHLCGENNNDLLVDQLAAWDIYLDLHLDFFPNRDFTQDIKVSNSNSKACILNNTGLGYYKLGLSTNSIQLYKRAFSIHIANKEWLAAGKVFHNLTYMYSDFGDLKSAKISIRRGLSCISHCSIQTSYQWQWSKHRTICTEAWIDFLQGDMESAVKNFKNAEKLIRMIDSPTLYLYALRGIHHSDCLRKSKRWDEAKEIIVNNLKFCRRKHLIEWVGCCHRVLGDLNADIEDHDNAKYHYQEAIRIIRNTNNYVTLIEALSARGRWKARYMLGIETTQEDLSEAIDYALSGGYRLHEADIRVSIAWMHLATNNFQSAEKEAKRAQQMSKKMGYYWGEVGAIELLSKLPSI